MPTISHQACRWVLVSDAQSFTPIETAEVGFSTKKATRTRPISAFAGTCSDSLNEATKRGEMPHGSKLWKTDSDQLKLQDLTTTDRSINLNFKSFLIEFALYPVGKKIRRRKRDVE